MLGNVSTNSTVRSKFNAYRGLGNSCPVCASTSGKCRWQNYELSAKNGKITPTIKTLCMTGAGGYGNPDYHYFNDTRDGQWGVYIPLIDWNEHRGENRQATPEMREEWVKNQKLKQQALLSAENQRKAQSLPALERDIAARTISAQLSLNEIDRRDLIRRGFTQQQIREIGFKSVEKFQRLTEPVNNRFPGVNVQGNRLSNGSIAGILIPIYTITGEIVAFQVRNREQSKSRYRWLSSVWEKGRDNGASPSLPNGENPLTFSYPQLLGVIPVIRSIGLAEGTGAKPNLAATRIGQQVIGAAGGQWLSSPELLKDGLERWRADVIDLYLDGEDIHKPQVIRRWINLYHQLLEWGYKPRFMYSGRDIDELEDLSLLREIDLDELEHLLGETHAEGTSARFHPLVGNKLPPPPPIISLARKLYQKSKHFSNNQTQCNRFLQWEIPETGLENTLVGIKSALGTGKTEILKALGAWAREHGLELIFIGYRNNLLRQTCDRIPNLYHVGDEDKVFLDSDYHKAICHHSAGLIDPAQMGNKIVILDECVSDLSDMLTSKLTAGRRKDGTDSRQVRLAHIEELIKHSHGVVALDAYLSDTELDFLRKLRQFDFVYKLENTYRNQMNVRMVNQKSTVTRAILDDALTGANLLITATTQKHCENLEKSLIRIGIPEADICRIDGTTDRNDTVALFFRNPKAYLEKYRPQIVILSPTAESGISIDLTGYFRTHYHFHLGNLGILSGLQFLGRYRDFSAPRVIYCERQGRINDGNSSSFTKWVKDEFDLKVHEDMDLVFMLLDKGAADEAMKILTSYANKEDLWLKLAHQYKANLNEEMKHLRELFVEAMVADGYTVTIDPEDVDGCDDTDDLMGRVEVERRVVQSRRIYDALDITRLEYEAIRNNPSANELDRVLASKYYLTQQQLPGIMETESYCAELIQMLKYNHPALVKQLETYHYLLHPERAEINHLAAWLPVAETGSVWFPDQLSRSSLALVKVGRELGLTDLIGTIFSGRQIGSIIDRISSSKRYQSSLKININPDKQPDPIKLFRRILKIFGLKLVKLGDDQFKLDVVADSILAFKGAPKYELLTPELSQKVAGLAGKQLHKDDLEIETLGMEMEALGMQDGRGRMRLVAGSARYLGLSVVTHRHRTIDPQGKKVVTRTYTFGTIQDPLSKGIKNSQVYPGTQPVHVKHIYECITKRLEQLAIDKQVRVRDWQNLQNPVSEELSSTIHIDDFVSIEIINLPEDQRGSPEFS
uniref:plasmid replication protein, CyRepA1 family n=1 Tax=Chamaesiphon sp. TaxID=2814140 RepID=UPI0035932846